MTEARSPGHLFGNRRRHHRIEVGQRLLLISVASRIDGELCDISQTGARVSLSSAPPLRGRDVLLRWGGHEIFGQVMWSRGNEVGVAFHKPISLEELIEPVGGEMPAALVAGRRVI